MGSLYDNSGEDIYARRDIEKRRKHAMAMKKKRKRQILKRKIMLFTGAAAILVASLGLTAAVRKNNTASGSSLNPKETQQVAIDANADAANDDNIDKKDEKYNAQTYDSLKGIRMPDAISVYTVDGIDYLITANEGDSRDWNGYSNEIEVNFGKGKTSPTGKITADNSGLTGKVTFFDTSDYDGLNNENDYLFGGRSSTIFKADEQSLQEIYTTGNDFEVKTAAYLPNNFNCSNDDATIDDRSGKKGPEAEAVTIGQIEDKIFAFIGLERIGGIMVYDITNPEKTEFVNYINSRDFSTDIGGDDSPEGIHFISSSDSITGKAQLIVAYEVSGTVGVYDLTLQKNDSEIPLV